MSKIRRTVIVSHRVRKKNGKGRLWAFGFKDLGALFDVHPDTVRRWIKKDEFDPGDLHSVAEFYLLHRPMKINRE